MSDLHKLLLNRVRQQEKALGLLLAEEEEGDEELPPMAPPSVMPVRQQPPTRFTGPMTYTPSQYDKKICNNYTNASKTIFPIQDKYGEFQTYFHPPSSAREPVFVCHHGAGSSSMTFAMLTEKLQEKLQEEEAKEGKQGESSSPGVFVFDMRCHGKSGGESDFSLSTLTSDFRLVYQEFLSRHFQGEATPSVFFIGHSLGGAVLTNYLTIYRDSLVKGFVMLDIVEETAVKSLVAMPQFIKRRPVKFDSYKRAIDWHLKETRLLHNEDSADISVPDLLTEKNGDLFWITDLLLTQPFWETWFDKLSSNFVTCGKNTAKLLILAGHENLDTELIIGQMQGKYQLIVFNNNPNAGHFIHEDIPNHIASSLIDFVRRNESPEDYMKKEFGFVPKWGGKINSK